MTAMRFDRRRFLALGAALGATTGIAAGVAATRAHALELQTMSPDLQRTYLSACEVPAKHAAMLAEVDAALAGQHLSPQRIAELRAASRCPICGCPLVVAAGPAPGPGAAPSSSF